MVSTLSGLNFSLYLDRLKTRICRIKGKSSYGEKLYSTELKTQHLIDQTFHSSFHMQTFINIISLFFGDLTFIFPDNSDS